MKNILFLIMIAAMTMSSYSQERATLPDGFQHKWVKIDLEEQKSQPRLMKNPPGTPANMHRLAPNEHDIGITKFDRQTNRMLQNRIHRFDDGTIGAVWIFGMEDPDFPDRGTGYNYYDGTQWSPIPQLRLESFRAGWPTYTAMGPGGEIIVSHDHGIGELCFLKRETKGVGTWNESMYTYSNGPATLGWPRVTSSGPDNNSIHLLALSKENFLGQDFALLYSRSQDGGITWNIENEVLEGTGSDYYTNMASDSYGWAEEENGTIAFLCGNVVWFDMFIMKSTDDGETWEKTIVWEHPYPFYNSNTVTDTFFSMDGSASIALDPDGIAHVTFGISRIVKPDAGGGIYLDPYIDGIGYWNENMESFSNDLDALAPPGMGFANSEMVEDYNYIGWMQDVDGNGTIDLNTDIMWYWHQWGASTMPSITVDDNHNVFVIYASTTEGYEIGDYNYKHIWVRGCFDGNWSEFVHLTYDISHIFDECIYPMFTLSSDNDLHYMYDVDQEPGLAQGMETHEHHENRVIYASITIPVGIREEKPFDSSLNVDVSPNPFTTYTTLSFRLFKPENVHFTVYNVQSQIVFTMQEKQDAGLQQLQWNAEGLPAGMYYFRIQAGEKVGSGKMIKVNDK